MTKQHQCEQMPEEVQVYYTDHYTTEEQWFLFVSETATEMDIELSHELNEVGELLWQTAFNIIHCPYCGLKFEKTTQKVTAHFHKAVNYKLI
ncbi:TPA: hypothetical protein ACGU7P_001117 [Vibrio vulnificus]|uniref:hypothetical protein n=1 Tax=Vibrio TaxID=662 RepID=UPI00148BBA60|nr:MULTISPECIES: hypothetical protein [Vibrio]EHK0048707.1 hypothetical protein [Vibrio parahaemolyticus]EHW0635165.1 hypothetical protein [Vibrio vulnificus]EIY9800881.1 hypothetical protein [Vibrio parahaemolyticus]EKA6048981.1 hypothetical protein [Vibrio vulnificus]MDG2644429.1 hypothetical protein [Vibrio parahaemolyticus]